MSISVRPLDPTPAAWPSGPLHLQALTAPTRCRNCQRWLSLDEDDLDALWSDPEAGVLCWTCDNADVNDRPRGRAR